METETFGAGDLVCVNLIGATLWPPPSIDEADPVTPGPPDWRPGSVLEARPHDLYEVRLDTRTVESGEPIDVVASTHGLRRRQPGEGCE